MNNENKHIKNLILVSASITIIDVLYLSFIGGKPFMKMVENIQGHTVTVDYKYAIIVYLLMIFGFYYFVILKKFTDIETIMLGIVIYGVFDFTNIDLFSNYNLFIAIQDMLWGGTLFYLTKKLFIYSSSLL